MRRRLVFTLPLFSLKQFSFLVIEIDTDDPEGVTDVISSEKRIRPAKRRRAIRASRDPSPDVCNSAADWEYDGGRYISQKDVRPKLRGFLSPCDILRATMHRRVLMHIESPAAGICAPTR